MFPKVPQSSQTESLGFPSYPLPLNTPPLKNPTIKWRKVRNTVIYKLYEWKAYGYGISATPPLNNCLKVIRFWETYLLKFRYLKFLVTENLRVLKVKSSDILPRTVHLTPWKMNGERNLQPSPMKRQEHDLNRTSRNLCSTRYSSGV